MVGIEMAPAAMAIEGLLATPVVPVGAVAAGAGGFGELLGSVLAGQAAKAGAAASADPAATFPLPANDDRPLPKGELDALLVSLLGMQLQPPAKPALTVAADATGAPLSGNVTAADPMPGPATPAGAAATLIDGKDAGVDGEATKRVADAPGPMPSADGIPVPEAGPETAPVQPNVSATVAPGQGTPLEQEAVQAAPSEASDGPAASIRRIRPGPTPGSERSGDAGNVTGPPTEASNGASIGVVRNDGNATSTGTQTNDRQETGTAPVATGVRRPQGATPRPIDGGTESPSSPLAAASAAERKDPASSAPVMDVDTAHAGRQPVMPPAEQVVRAVVERVHEGGGRAVVRLDPPELGHVEVRVSTNHGSVHVDVLVERPEALSLLRGGTPDLQAMLQGRGLDLGNVNVGLGGGYMAGGSNSGGQEQPRQQRPEPGAFASILGIDANAAVAGHNRLRAAYNPDGRVVYRV